MTLVDPGFTPSESTISVPERLECKLSSQILQSVMSLTDAPACGTNALPNATQRPRPSRALELAAAWNRRPERIVCPSISNNQQPTRTRRSYAVARLASIWRASAARKGHLAREGLRSHRCYCDSTERRRVPNAGRAPPPRRATGTKSPGASHPSHRGGSTFPAGPSRRCHCMS